MSQGSYWFKCSFNITRRRFALETTMARFGRALKKLTLEYKTTSLDAFIDYLKPKFKHFVKCKFVARWEDR
jgi:hypothetical protein